jgi:hypothetical protein
MVIQMPFEAIVMQKFEAIARVNEILLGRVEFQKLAPTEAPYHGASLEPSTAVVSVAMEQHC